MRAILISLIASLFAIAQQPAQESGGRIEGIVVKAGTDEALPNAVLLLSKDGSGRLDPKYGSTTRSDGRFTLKDIPKGRYRLSASLAGFVDEEYGQKRPNAAGAVLDLTNAQTLGDITIRLTPGGVISGRVYDQTGRPLEGTVVEAFRRRYQPTGKSSLSPVSVAMTNDLGEYRIYWLSPGTYYVFAMVLPTFRGTVLGPIGSSVINKSEHAPETFSPTFYPNGDDDSQATPITVEAGAELRGMDFSLTRMKAVKVQGRIVDSDSGRPIPEANIEMWPKYLDSENTRGIAAHVDAEGNFDFQNAAPGRYIITARIIVPGFRQLSDRREVQIGNRDITDLEIRLKPNPNIRGRLVAEGGEALPRDRTLLVLKNYDNPANATFGTGVEADGTFSLSNVSPGVLHLELTGFPDNFYIRSARTDEGDVLADGLDVTDHSVDSLVVTVGSQGGTVDGMIYGDRQEPIIAAHVVLVSSSSRHPAKVVTTDHTGRFTIRGIVPGDYKVLAWEDVEPNAYFDPLFMERYETQGTPLHIEANGQITANIKAIPLS